MPYRRKDPWYDNGQPCPRGSVDGDWDENYEWVPEEQPVKPDLRPVVQRYKERENV